MIVVSCINLFSLLADQRRRRNVLGMRYHNPLSDMPEIQCLHVLRRFLIFGVRKQSSLLVFFINTKYLLENNC